MQRKHKDQMGMKSIRGEIVQVEGGHIVRSIGRKDRHSKVYTAKGPRDRRVRLSAHTAIQFYDVQDRLGYDRPSKAVDWLIKKAKSAIDKLAELPPWQPPTNMASTSSVPMDPDLNQQMGENSNPHNDSCFIPPQLDSDPIADTMKTFFPISANSSINFQNYSYPHDPANNSQQDLCLSLHSYQDPNGQSSHTHSTEQTLFAGPGPVAFDIGSGDWTDQHHPSPPPDMSRFQRMVAWSALTTSQQQQLLSQGPSEFTNPRGSLQSSFATSVRAWDDLSMASDNHDKSQAFRQTGYRFASDGFSGFPIPTRFHCQDEQPPISPNSRR